MKRGKEVNNEEGEGSSSMKRGKEVNEEAGNEEVEKSK